MEINKKKPHDKIRKKAARKKIDSMSPRRNRQRAHDEVHDSHRDWPINISIYLVQDWRAWMHVLSYFSEGCAALHTNIWSYCSSASKKLLCEGTKTVIKSGYRCKKPNEASDIGESQKIKSLKVQCVVLLFFFRLRSIASACSNEIDCPIKVCSFLIHFNFPPRVWSSHKPIEFVWCRSPRSGEQRARPQRWRWRRRRLSRWNDDNFSPSVVHSIVHNKLSDRSYYWWSFVCHVAYMQCSNYRSWKKRVE